MSMAVSKEVQWLRGAPRCRAEGSMVYVTLSLEPSRLDRPTCVGWSAGGLHTTTPRVKGSSVTCCVPRGIFEHRALVRLQLIGSAESDSPIFAWTQIPVLEETMFRAEMVLGQPILSPLGLHMTHTLPHPALSRLD